MIIESMTHLIIFDLGKYFSAIIGGGDLPDLKPDPSGIVHIINDQKNLGFDLKRVWMVGDTHTDLNAAASAGVNSVYCKFGFGDHGGVHRDFEISCFWELVEIVRE